jgi:hypothetical protein
MLVDNLNSTALGVLTAIPIVDVRELGLAGRALAERERARGLRDACLSIIPAPLRGLLPLLDATARRWLLRSPSAYVKEIEAIADALGFSGVWFLNASYQWGCTTLAREQAGLPWLARTLDWPFPGLGRYMEVVQMTGQAGDFASVTWPGYAGCLTAIAPGRFAATVNQAPMWRRTRHPWLRPYDVALNAVGTWNIRFAPPDHLLRQVFELARDYREARTRLEETPIARPVIYTLAGCRAGERCVIERTETTFRSRDEDTGAANDWLQSTPRWEARIRPDKFFTRSYAEAAENSRVRRAELQGWTGEFGTRGFDWVRAPVLNPYTRLAVEMCAATGALRVMGYESIDGQELSQPATLPFEMNSAIAAPV